MIYSSHTFLLLFLPISFFIYITLVKKKSNFTQIFILIFSIIFYCYFSIWNFFILFLSVIFNYFISRKVQKKSYLYIAILVNLLFLAFFKYNSAFIFFSNHYLDTSINNFNILLPLAISFFTLQQIGYQFDIYYKEIKPSKKFVKYFLFVTFFPQLIAGPIVHYKQVEKKFNLNNQFKTLTKTRILGLILFIIGLSKKVLIADQIDFYSDLLFDGLLVSNSINPTFIPSWTNTIMYSFQLYFDFSGYSDMAVGLGMMFGVKLPFNFLSPFKAVSIIDFWSRWHITLSNFVNMYIFSNILRKFQPNFIIILFATIISFLIIGIWHGPKINYFYFGLIQGFLVIAYRVYTKIRQYYNIPELNKYLAITITFLLINFSLIFFRAENTNIALNIIKGMLGLNGMGFYIEYFDRLHVFKHLYSLIGGYGDIKPTYYFYGLRNLFYILPLGFIIFFLPNSKEILEYVDNNYNRVIVKLSIISGTLIFLSLIGITEVKEFIYFQF